MAEEHIGTAFGAVGALDILTRNIKDGFAFWQRIQSSNQSITNFKILLDLQEGRFLHWAQEWGIEQNLHNGDRSIRMHQAKIVIPYLQQIQQITRQLSDDFNATLPTLGENQNLGIMETIASQLSSTSGNPHASDKLGIISTTPREKVNWTFQEKKFNDGMTLLRSLLNELYMCFPIPKQDPVGPILYVSSLRSQNPTTLAYVGHVADDPLEKGLALSKSLVYMPPSAKTSVSHLIPAKLIENTPSNDKLNKKLNRFVGTYDGRLVLVERKSSKVPQNTISQMDTVNRRIENIVMRLQDESKPHQLRTLPCCGVTRDYSFAGAAGEWFITDYNIVYKIDTPTFFSLRQLLSQSNSNKSEPKDQKIRGVKTGISLGQRFIIAQTLASAVMCLHLADWLHKAIRSENILFFAESMAKAGYTLPYLVGFEYSRLDAPDERTEDIVDEDEYVYYRHPDAHFVPVADLQQPLGGAGRYSKLYDIYSFGVILVELGLFKSARSIVRTYMGPKAKIHGEAVKKVLLDEVITELSFYTGEVYANAARVCLDGFSDKDDKDDLPSAFSKYVVRPLSYCQA
jgi:hypothetical protein